MSKKLVISLFVFLSVALGSGTAIKVNAQTTTADTGFSPYSLYAFGDLANPGSAYHKSMGGIGIGDRNVMFINMINPAAVTARERQSFMFDFGIEQKNTYFAANQAASGGLLRSARNDGGAALAMTKAGLGDHLFGHCEGAEGDRSNLAGALAKSVNNSFNMNHIVASFPIAKHSAFKLGIAPYSGVGYKFIATEGDDKVIAEVGDVKYAKVGQGGIYQAFLGAGVTFFDRLSIGADGKYFFGTINRYSTAYFTTNTSYRTIKSGWDFVARGFTGKVGIQYQQPLGGSTSMTIGATYQFATDLGGDITRYAYASSESGEDTVSFNTTPMANMSIPQEFGVGITIRNPEKWMVGFDYTRQDWRNTSLEATPGIDFQPSLSQSFRAGFEYTPNRYDIRYFFKRLTYKGGIYHNQSYFTLNGNDISATGITLGVSVPVFRYYNSITVGIDMGQRGSLANNMVRERYFLFTVAFSLHDIWFIKPLYQ